MNRYEIAEIPLEVYINETYKIPFCFMAARNAFEVNFGIGGKVLQQAGVFSVDWEG